MRRLPMILLLAGAVSVASAAMTTTDSTTVQLKRGSTIAATFADLSACETSKSQRIATEALIRFSGTATYSCIETRKTVARFSADVCPAQPTPLARVVDCPAGSTGAYTQTRSYVSAPHPTCWSEGEWLPTEPPNGACTPIPPADSDGDGVPDATDRCPTVAASTPDGCPVEPGPITWTRCAGENQTCAFEGTRVVRYGAGTAWSERELTGGTVCSNSVFGDPAFGVVKSCELRSGSVPAPDPVPANGFAVVSWTPRLQLTDGSPLTDLAGFRVYYGPSALAMTRVVDVRDPAAIEARIDGLSAGTWHFAVTQVRAGGISSALSSVATKTVE